MPFHQRNENHPVACPSVKKQDLRQFYIGTSIQRTGEARGVTSDPPGNGVSGGCWTWDVGAWNSTWVSGRAAGAL